MSLEDYYTYECMERVKARKKMINKKFVKKEGKYGFQIGKIMPNKKHVGIRFWFTVKGKTKGFEKSFFIGI